MQFVVGLFKPKIGQSSEIKFITVYCLTKD